MAGFSKVSSIMKVIVKYLPPQKGEMIQLFMIINDLKEMKNRPSNNTQEMPDMKTLLYEIMNNCDDEEKQNFNNMLNMLNAFEYYNNNKEMFSTIFSMMQNTNEQSNYSQPDFDQANSDQSNFNQTNYNQNTNSGFNNTNGTQSNNSNMNGMYDMLSGVLSPEKQEMFQSMREAMQSS